jgi:hypothetical protein
MVRSFLPESLSSVFSGWHTSCVNVWQAPLSSGLIIIFVFMGESYVDVGQ